MNQHWCDVIELFAANSLFNFELDVMELVTSSIFRECSEEIMELVDGHAVVKGHCPLSYWNLLDKGLDHCCILRRRVGRWGKRILVIGVLESRYQLHQISPSTIVRKYC